MFVGFTDSNKTRTLNFVQVSYRVMTGSDINSYAGEDASFTKAELQALAEFLGVSTDGITTLAISPNDFEDESNYMFVGSSDSGSTRTLNFMQVTEVTDRVWNASATDFSTLVFEEGMKI